MELQSSLGIHGSLVTRLCGYQNLRMLKSLISNGVVFAVTYILYIGCNRTRLHITLSARIQPCSVWQIQALPFGIFWCFLIRIFAIHGWLKAMMWKPRIWKANYMDIKDTALWDLGPYMGTWSVIPRLCHPHLHYVPATLPILQTCWACFFLTAFGPGMLSRLHDWLFLSFISLLHHPVLIFCRLHIPLEWKPHEISALFFI